MHLNSQTWTLQAESVYINLKAGEALECAEGVLWLTRVVDREEVAPIDELLYPGDLLLSVESQAYCLSNLKRKQARYRLVRPRNDQDRSSVKLAGGQPAYTLVKANQGSSQGAFA
jgi:hypothetical protein